MMNSDTKKAIIAECKALCERFGLDQAYLAEPVGPRRHYLAGYGPSVTERPQQLRLSDSLVLFWQGELSDEGCAECRQCLQALTKRLQEEL